ncbi:MAG TPA: DinB family protein [Chitinophagales bacterium]|nr:DinB family protein [Chitinophagales bacterium]
MSKPEITTALTEKYSAFTNYINSISATDYMYSYNGKWTAGQQLEHIVICVKPLVQVFSMDKNAIAQTFGTTNKTGRDYETLLSEYQTKLTEGGKAPTKFVPDTITTIEQRPALTETLPKLINKLNEKIETFSEQELDTLCIPHPLLGSISLREMLYNAIYHVQHHQNAAVENLKHNTATA